jgi:hypothetical protein
MTAGMPPYEDDQLLARALARGADCPPLERLVAAALGDLPAAESAPLLAHAEGCAACGAEVALASRCAAADTGSAAVEQVVERLRAAGGEQPPGRVIEFPGDAPRRGGERARTRRPAPAWTRWAAAALLVAGVGLIWEARRTPAPPELPGPGTTDVVRGGELQVLAPVGEVIGAPAELSWRPVEAAAKYRVELADVGGESLGGGESTSARFALPPELANRLRERATYTWQVVAFDADGRELARSSRVEFTVRPALR